MKRLIGLARDIASQGKTAEEASLQVGLLVEREMRFNAQYRGLIAPAYFGYRPKPKEIEKAKGILRRYVSESDDPPPRAVWALARFLDPAAMEPVETLLLRSIGARGREELCATCVDALIVCWSEEFGDAFKLVARRDRGDAGAKAKAWLKARSKHHK